MTKRKTNGAKRALSMSEQNSKDIGDLKKIVEPMAIQVADIHVALLGSLDNPDKPGLIERLRTVESSVGVVKRFGWLVIGGFVTAIFALAVAVAMWAVPMQ